MMLSREFKSTMLIRILGITKIPMIWFCKPSVVEIDEDHCVLKIKLKRKTKNHVNSMYIGALTVGADLAGGILALELVNKSGRKMNPVFKDMQANYLKRAEGNVYFTCTGGAKIKEMVKKAVDTGERINQPVNITATVPDKLGNKPVAEFVLTLSLKDITPKYTL